MLEEILSLSKVLISVPTVTGDEKALDLAVEIAYQDLYDFNLQQYTHNGISSLLYYNTPTLPDRFKVLMSTNLDVVSANEAQFQPRIVGNKLYGRGAYDVKTAAAAMILAFKDMAKKVDYPLGLQIVADGELDSQSIRHQIEEGVRADFVISSIPTNMAISHMSKGMLWMKVRTKVKGSHGASPWIGENAIWKMKPFLDKLQEAYPVPKEESWMTTVNLAKIGTTNKEFNNVPDNCEVLLDIRYIPEDEDTIIEKITSLVPDGFESEVVLNDQSEFTSTENAEFMALCDSIEKITGEKAHIIKKHYADSVRYFKPFGGRGASFGPKGANEHATDEWVDIQSVSQYYQILKDFLSSIKV